MCGLDVSPYQHLGYSVIFFHHKTAGSIPPEWEYQGKWALYLSSVIWWFLQTRFNKVREMSFLAIKLTNYATCLFTFPVQGLGRVWYLGMGYKIPCMLRKKSSKVCLLEQLHLVFVFFLWLKRKTSISWIKQKTGDYKEFFETKKESAWKEV